MNGPASVHSEYALLAGIVIAADITVFTGFPHLTLGIVPGDGVYLAWEEAIGGQQELTGQRHSQSATERAQAPVR